MSTPTKRSLGLIAVVTAVGSLTACGAGAPGSGDLAGKKLVCELPEGAVVVAASSRANAPAPTPSSTVEAALAHALGERGFFAVVGTDGRPTVIDKAALRVDAKNGPGREAQEQQLAAEMETLIAVPAKAPEANPLKALSEAARTAKAQGATGTVVLVDSGLQTTGDLRYQHEGMLLATNSDVVDYLKEQHALPDLHGVTVILSGLGDTAAPQEPLTAASRERLVGQWKAIVRAAGASCVVVDQEPLTNKTPADLPAVTVVPVPRPQPMKLDASKPIALREDSVGFEDNSAELRDREGAMAALRDLGKAINQNGVSVRLVGTTATYGTEEGRLVLSRARAESVKKLLVSLGVSASRVSTSGVGTHYPLLANDLDKDGQPIPALAAKNRAVFVEVVR